MSKIFFISGMCGAGKTTVQGLLKNSLPKGQFEIHDLHERDAPKDGGQQWRLGEFRHWVALGDSNAAKNISTIVTGLSRPSEMKLLTPHAKIEFCLLDVLPETVEKRLLGRYNDHAFAKNMAGSEDFMNELREEFKSYGSKIIVTDTLTPEQVALEVKAWITSSVQA